MIGGPGTAFEQQFYDERGIPALIRVGNTLENSMYEALQAWLPRNTAIGEYGLSRLRIAAGVAKITITTPDGASVLANAYLRLENIDSWRVLGAAASFEPAWHEQNGIPEVLR